jgi:alkaline phosphatase D
MSTFDQSLDNLAGPGIVDGDSARIWVRSSQPGTHVLQIWPESGNRVIEARFDVPADPARDQTTSVRWPHDFEHVPKLEPLTRYHFAVRRPDGFVVGQGRFETAPPEPRRCPSRFSIAIMSCHQPFDDEGEFHAVSERQLSVLEALFEEHAVKRVLLLGDQMYSDLPERLSLFNPEYFARVAPPGRDTIFDCSAQEIRRIYQRRYRTFWNHPAWNRMLSSSPCHMIMDDHELIDNFGSHREHATPRWAALRAGALDAFFDYQALRVRAPAPERPSSLHFSFEYGPVAVFVMDLRSQRVSTNGTVEIYGDDQLEALANYLEQQSHRSVFVLGLSVPLVYLPAALADLAVRIADEGSDAHDRWGHERARHARTRLIRLLCEHQMRHPKQRLILVSGDIHTGVISEIVWTTPKLRALQLISSAVSNVEGLLVHALARFIPRLGVAFDVVDEAASCSVNLLGKGDVCRNPYGGLNVGILEFSETYSETPQVRLKLVGHDESSPARPRVVCDTDTW